MTSPLVNCFAGDVDVLVDDVVDEDAEVRLSLKDADENVDKEDVVDDGDEGEVIDEVFDELFVEGSFSLFLSFERATMAVFVVVVVVVAVDAVVGD